MHYARFQALCCGDANKCREVYKTATEASPDCVKLWLAWAQWEASMPISSHDGVQSVIRAANAADSKLSDDAKLELAEWHLEYLADFGTIAKLYENEQAYGQQFPSAEGKSSKKRSRDGGDENAAAKKAAVDQAAAAQAQAQAAQQAYQQQQQYMQQQQMWQAQQQQQQQQQFAPPS